MDERVANAEGAEDVVARSFDAEGVEEAVVKALDVEAVFDEKDFSKEGVFDEVFAVILSLLLSFFWRRKTERKFVGERFDSSDGKFLKERVGKLTTDPENKSEALPGNISDRFPDDKPDIDATRKCSVPTRRLARWSSLE